MSDNRIPEMIKPVYDALAESIGRSCTGTLGVEYRDLCLRAASVLCRKRPSSLLRGRLNAWACGIVYAIGQVNFLFDSSQKPSMSARDLCKMFGVSTSTGSAKAREVSKMLRTYPMDPHWSIPSKLDDNPIAWMINVNGFVVDARTLPRSVQEIAFQKGLIPYLPLDGAKQG
jgi:hypothetical protein